MKKSLREAFRAIGAAYLQLAEAVEDSEGEAPHNLKEVELLHFLAGQNGDPLSVRPNQVCITAPHLGTPVGIGRSLARMFPTARSRTAAGSLFVIPQAAIATRLAQLGEEALGAPPEQRESWIATRGQEIFDAPGNRNTIEVCLRKAEDEWIAERGG